MGTQSAQPSTRRLVRSGALAGAIAAVCTTVVAAIASAADVSLEINATAIPIPALAWWTIIGAALGIVFARKPSATEYGGASDSSVGGAVGIAALPTGKHREKGWPAGSVYTWKSSPLAAPRAGLGHHAPSPRGMYAVLHAQHERPDRCIDS